MLALAREFGVPDLVTAAGANLLRRTMIAVGEPVYRVLVIGALSPCSIEVLASLDEPGVIRAYATCVRIATKVLGCRADYPPDLLTTWMERFTGVRFPDSTIRHLELDVLDALEWRLGCVEPLEPGELVTLGEGAPAVKPARDADASTTESHAGSHDADFRKKRLRGVLLSPLFGGVAAGRKRVPRAGRDQDAGADGEESAVRADDGVLGQRQTA